MRAVSVISGAIAFTATAALSVLLPTQMSIALWRPIEVLGAGFIFSIDKLVWPFLLLASAAVFAEVLLDGRSAMRLLYSGIALAAIAGGNMLAIAVLWTLMILLESVLRLRNSLELDATIQKATIQFVAVAAVLAVVALGEGASILLVFAALIRSIGGTEERFPFSLAVLAPLGALAVVSRSSPDESIQLWLAVGAIAVVLVRSLLYIPRLSSLALALTAAGLLVPPEAQAVAWASLAAVLVATLGLSQAGGSRSAWIAVAIIPSAFLSGGTYAGLFLLVTFATIVLAIVSRWLPLGSHPWPPSRVEAVVIAVLIGGAIWASLGAGWRPNLEGALSASAAMTVSYAIARSWPALSKTMVPVRPLLTETKHAGRTISKFLAGSIRIVADVLEGESAVLWILLALLIVIVGLRVVIA